MKFLSLFLSAVWALAGTVSLVHAKAVVGEAAPAFTVTDLQGKTHRSADFQGKTVVLEWTNPECPFVVKHYASGNMPALQKAATADGVVWITINSGKPSAQGDYDPAAVAAWMKETGAAPTAYVRDSDGTVGRAFGAKVTPHLFVIAPDGKLAYAGAIDSVRSTKASDIPKATNYVTATLAALKAGQPVEKTTTDAYGCGIKY
jgi:peroxiredoxin